MLPRFTKGFCPGAFQQLLFVIPLLQHAKSSVCQEQSEAHLYSSVLVTPPTSNHRNTTAALSLQAGRLG